jgi:hypothetical protein
MRGDALKIPSGGRSLNGHDCRSFGVRSMVVRDLHFVSPIGPPDKADTVLIVDADAVLTGAVSLQSLKPVAGREAQIAQIGCSFDLVELATSRIAAQRLQKPVSKSFFESSSLKLRIIHRQNITDRVTCQAVGSRVEVCAVFSSSGGAQANILAPRADPMAARIVGNHG